jgi:hypothetical protein
MSGTGITCEEAAQRLDGLNRLGFQLSQRGLYPQALEILGQRASSPPRNLQPADSPVSGSTFWWNSDKRGEVDA